MGKGDVPLTTVMLAHRALGQLILLTPAESRARTELPRSTRIMTNTQNWKNFRNGEESQRMRSSHSLVQPNNDRHDTDDDGGRGQTGGTLMEIDYNDTTEAPPFTARSMTPSCQIQVFPQSPDKKTVPITW